MEAFFFGRSWGVLEALGEPPGAKMPQGADWDVLGAPSGGLLERILAPRWGQDGAKLNLRWATCAHFWEDLGDFFWILGAILPKLAKTRKTTTVHHFC